MNNRQSVTAAAIAAIAMMALTAGSALAQKAPPPPPPPSVAAPRPVQPPQPAAPAVDAEPAIVLKLVNTTGSQVDIYADPQDGSDPEGVASLEPYEILESGVDAGAAFIAAIQGNPIQQFRIEPGTPILGVILSDNPALQRLYGPAIPVPMDTGPVAATPQTQALSVVPQTDFPQSGFPPAASWGGVVRAGPGMEHLRVDSLSEGEPVEILNNTGAMMNGYPWFEIRYRGGKTGYQWGGILCGRGQPIPGAFEVCN